MGRVLKKSVATALAVIMILSLCTGLTGCGDGRTKLYVYNWGEYIDEEVLEIFEQEYPQYNVIYDTFATNEEMYQKVASGSVAYDVLIPSDYMIERMVKEDFLVEIDTSSMENYGKIKSSLLGTPFDPEEKYSVPYMWGTLGIIYNTKMVDEEVDSWSVLWDKKYEGQILMLESVRDTLGFSLKRLGYSLNTTSEKEINEARDELIKAKPLFADWGVDTIKDPIKNGHYAFGVTWSGDAMEIMSENEDIAYVVPKEGSNFWIDAMVIPKTSKNIDGAKLFIDFMCRTDIALMNAEEIGYSTPQMEVLDILGEDYINDEVYNPPEEIIENCEVFVDLGEHLIAYNSAWEKIRLFS
ncbi:MAG: ABC transporter substrate-binding protein [Ruminococcaceae bacterium]|nr:ABC transporter substrate-binding protein [Oscillospiraceae bacterium]